MFASVHHRLCHLLQSTNANDEQKPSKIFRPWDVHNLQQQQQDSTISTTTSEEDSSTVSDVISNKTGESSSEPPPPPPPPSTSTSTSSSALEQLVFPSAYHLPSQDYLGLPTTSTADLTLLTQNAYALEEYARVLSQDHQAKLLAARKQRPKKYKCPHCDVGFSNNGQLKGHIRIHTGERPFHCDAEKCGKTFTRNEELTRHKRIHSGLRPFACAQCGKRFGRKDHLKKHSRTHMQQPRNGGVYAVPVMLPYETWAAGYPYMPLLY